MSATTEEGKKISQAIYLYQSAEEEAPYWIKFNPTELAFSEKGGKQELTSTCNFAWYYMNKKRSYSVNGEDKHEWFSLNPVKYDNTGTNGIYTDQWEIEVEENNWGFTRDATITIVVTDKEETLSATTVINIIQGDGSEPTISVEPSSLRFGPDGGELELKVTTNQSRYGFRFDDNSWLSGDAQPGGVIKLKAKANDTGADRSATMTVYGSDFNRNETVTKDVIISQAASSDLSKFLKKYKDKLDYVTVELIGKVNRTWTHDGESPSTEVLAINNWVPTNAFTSYNTTVTENNGGLHIVSASAEDGKSINISLDLIEETDQLCITNLKYKFDTEDANSYQHLFLEASNMHLGKSANYSNGNKANGCIINSLTDETKNKWGIVHTPTGQYFDWKFSTKVNGMADDNYNIWVRFNFRSNSRSVEFTDLNTSDSNTITRRVKSSVTVKK